MSVRSHRFAAVADVHAFSHGEPDSLPRLRLSDAMLPPKNDEALRPKGESEREIIGAMNQLLVCTPERRILVDGGPDGDAVQRGLQEIGILPDQITDVLITHGDHDHILGLVDAEGSVRYPNARHALPRMLWRVWEEDRVDAFYMPEQRSAALTLRQLPQHLVCAFTGADCILPGVDAVPLPGHRPEHTGYRFDLGDRVLIALGDLLIHPFFLEDLSRGFVHDSDPEMANDSRRAFLQISAGSRPLLFSTHFPCHGLWTASATAGAFSWTPLD